MRTHRKIVSIDENKCDGCGQCATACAEGAIEIVGGKARLVSETYCDGLGACLGECPQGAIAIEEREADEFDAEAVEQHLQQRESSEKTLACGCPGAMAQTLERRPAGSPVPPPDDALAPSQLANWPVQIHLVPPNAPYLHGAHLLIAADCVPFAFADFHRTFLSGRTLLVGCPKLDDAPFYAEKLTQILRDNDIASVRVVHMEVPCCFGLVALVRQAIAESGRRVPLTVTKVGVRGQLLTAAEQPATASPAP